MPVCAKSGDQRPALLLMFFACVAITACSGEEAGNNFTTQQVDARWANGRLMATLHQQLLLSNEARRALQHGVPLTLQVELVIRNGRDKTRIRKNQQTYEIRYLPLSNHYQLTLPGGHDIKTFPRLRHLLADLSLISLSFRTGVMPSGDYELLARTRMDKRKIPPPMRLPTLFSSEWRHDSDWSTWPFEIQPQA